jgi:hypothetical protein
VEGERIPNNPDVTMSDAPGDGGDEDAHTHARDKPRGSDIERNVKRTKNVGDTNNEKGTSKSSQKSNANSLGMQMMKSGCVGAMERNFKVVTNSENTPRYDDVFFSSNKLCVSPKQIYSCFSGGGW